MAGKKKQKLPEVLHIVLREPDTDDAYFMAAEQAEDLGIEVGDEETIGVYELIGLKRAKGVVMFDDMEG